METAKRKLNAARVSIATATSLALIKVAAGLATGSLAVLSSAIDSLLDIFMSGVNYLAIRQADQPADENHPFGHGKYETVASLFQALIVALSGGWIIYEAVQRLIAGTAPTRLTQGVAVLLLSSVVSWLISRYLQRVGRATDSSALQADSLHFSMDVYTNLALLAGLALMYWLPFPWIDPVLSMLVAGYIFFEAIRLLRHGLRDILDEELPSSIRDEITRLIDENKCELSGYHNLRTRRAGSQKIMDFHLAVCKHLSVEEGHAIADRLEKKIEENIQGADVTIHIEPCRRTECPGPEHCTVERARFQTDD